MRRIWTTAILVFVWLLSATPFVVAQSTPYPIKITVLPFEGSALASDKEAPYENGVGGVYNAQIHVGTTKDATMNLQSGSKRSVGLTFGSPLPNSIIDGPSPSWANGVRFYARPGFGIRNILWGRLNGYSVFTTTMGIGSIAGPGDKTAYRLQFRPPLTDAVVGETFGLPSNMNTPEIMSYVTVQDIPGTCRTQPNGTLDMWIVTAQNPSPTNSSYIQVGTLYKEQRGSLIHSGQYSFPFKLLIEATACLPY